jgi:parallel beta-helix repeat protein
MSDGGTVEASTARENGGRGFFANSHVGLSLCSANNNTKDGIFASQSTLTGCTADENGGHGFSLMTSLLADSFSRNNSTNGVTATNDCTVARVFADYNADNGILADEGCTISDCTVTRNTGDGIEVSQDCRVVNNTCEQSGRSTGSGAGIYVTGSDNRIEGNHMTDGDYGLLVGGTGNLIVKNTASGNSTEYSIASGNWTGPIDTSSAGTITNMSPWVNFDF